MTVTEIRPVAPSTSSTMPDRRAPVAVLRDDTPAAPASVRVASRPPRGTGFAKYRYLIAKDVRVVSDVALPELNFFRTGKLDGPPDIEIRRGPVGPRSPRGRALMTQFDEPAAVRYEEHLGLLGANFSIDLGSPIRVVVSPLLALSPHVLYTNVIEALLRFVFVSRGRMLLHSACVEIDSVGVMLSAKTDTGKTGTVLRLLREKNATFLSDDMTVIDSSGTAWSYPKPLTISAHTLRAVDPGDIGRFEWMVLNVKGRLHSKGGRSVGMGIGERNLPVMSANALVQMMIPPPKYAVDRLVRCELTESTQVRELFVIERGEPAVSAIGPEQTVTELLENTDDAYGFPPFRYFAPCLVIGGSAYQELRAAEAEILRAALTNVRVRRVASNTFGWADEIPKLLDTPQPSTSMLAGQSSGA